MDPCEVPTLNPNPYLHDPSDPHAVTDLVAHYNSELSSHLDVLFPLKRRVVSFNIPAPWYNPELRAMKATG